MSMVKKYNAAGAATGEVEIPAGLLEMEKGSQAVHDVVVALTNARRAGTACTLTKGEVNGTGAKPWKQKGTGRARAGYRQSTIWRGGATTFGPRPRDYSVKVNRKVMKLAFRRALSEKLESGAVRVVEPLMVDIPKTKAFAALLKAQQITGAALVIVDTVGMALAMAVRNLPKVELVKAADVNVYQLLRYPVVLVNGAGLEQLMARLAK
ncbi:MAG TPA: 50S ribosomal protein L4 [Verrucomicrobia bacterium]|nr:50S ribosomal protein L4 [Verrucomicrobiota bacterium]